MTRPNASTAASQRGAGAAKQRLARPHGPTSLPIPAIAKGAARQLADGVPDKLREAYGRGFCAVAIGHYWERVHGRRGRPLRAAPVVAPALSDEAASAALALGEVAATLCLEDASYLLGSTYAAMLPDDMRSSRGVYYTPPGVVERLLDLAASAGVDWSTCRALDPACGGGAFLGPVAVRMLRAMASCDPRMAVRNVSQRLKGYEIDPFAAWISHVFLDAVFYAELSLPRVEHVDVVDVGDSLARSDAGTFDLVIGNPPYGRVTLDPARRTTYARSLYGHANLYGLFLDLAVRKAGGAGVIAYVTPTSFLSGEYFKRLRALLVADAPPVAIDFVADRDGVFDDVLQETALAVFRRGATPSSVSVHHVATGPNVRVTDLGECGLPGSPELPWLLPRSEAASPLIRAIATATTRLGDWGYRVSTGPLVWNRHKERLRWKHVRGSVPLLWAECVTADGEFVFRALRRNHAPYFVPESDDSPNLVTRACVLVQRTTAKEQSRRLIAAHLPGDFIEAHGAVAVENHVNMVVPLTIRPAVDSATVAAFLNSAAADRVFRCISGSVAVSAYELEAMPLPSADSMRSVSDAVGRRASRAEVDRIITGLYET